MPELNNISNFRQQVIFEDNYILVLNKPAGMSSEGPKGLSICVSNYFKEQYPWKKQIIAGVVHRLDRPASGVIIFAKTKMALKNLNEQFAKRRIEKRYLVICENEPIEQEGFLTNWLVKNKELRRAQITGSGKNEAKEAQLKYSVVESKNGHSLIKVDLLTGRYHQIRVQFAAIGCPVVGDVLYGGKIDDAMRGGIYLHSYALVLEHPKSGDKVQFNAPIPDYGLWQIFKQPQ